MKITHANRTYECAVAVKCESDKYIKLYDENGVEIASFLGISNFGDFTISGGSFVDPCGCSMPIPLSIYSIGGRTINTNDWILNDGRYCYEITSDLISANKTTCNVSLFFAPGTELAYEATQEEGKIGIYTDAAPLFDVVIDSVQLTRV